MLVIDSLCLVCILNSILQWDRTNDFNIKNPAYLLSLSEPAALGFSSDRAVSVFLPAVDVCECRLEESLLQVLLE